MTRSEQINLRMGSDNPEAVQVALERLDRRPLAEVPYSNCLIFADREDEFLVGVEETSRRILEVAAAGIDFPCLRLC